MDQLPSEYLELCERVRKINPKAARWMLNEAPKQPSFKARGDLFECFTWSSTPQTTVFWYQMYERLKTEPVKSPVIPLAATVELWWQRDRRLQAAKRVEVFALRNAIRAICGQEHY